jgi:hypothetical protein
MDRESLRRVQSSVMGVMGIGATISGTSMTIQLHLTNLCTAFNTQALMNTPHPLPPPTKKNIYILIYFVDPPTSDGDSGLPEMIS